MKKKVENSKGPPVEDSQKEKDLIDELLEDYPEEKQEEVRTLFKKYMGELTPILTERYPKILESEDEREHIELLMFVKVMYHICKKEGNPVKGLGLLLHMSRYDLAPPLMLSKDTNKFADILISHHKDWLKGKGKKDIEITIIKI